MTNTTNKTNLDDLACLKDSVIEPCKNKEIAETQRHSELDSGSDGLFGYQKIGCYECDGLNTGCSKYFNQSTIASLYAMIRRDA
jgi:hypothetical protein